MRTIRRQGVALFLCGWLHACTGDMSSGVGNDAEPDVAPNDGGGQNDSPVPYDGDRLDSGDTPEDSDSPVDSSDSDAPTVAESDYEGYGMTRGAESSSDGYETCHVTSLADEGEGTLRDCVSESNRFVVFDLGGTIMLESTLNIPHSYITIAGETAPAPGITIFQPGDVRTSLEASGSRGPIHDVVIRYLRNIGDCPGGHSNDGDIWGMDGQANEVHHIVIDHVTGSTSCDGVFDVYWNVNHVTISWSLITHTVAANHMSGEGLRERISFHHNVMAHNNERQIRLRHNTQIIDCVNNVIYGWGWYEGGAYGLRIVHDPDESNPSANIVNNVLHFVPGLDGDVDDAVILDTGPDQGDVYFSGNTLPPEEHDAISSVDGPIGSEDEAARVTTLDAAELVDAVVPLAGTHYPTAEEMELLAQIQADIRE